MKIFKKEYEGEDIYDLEGDLIAKFDELYSQDPNGLHFDSDGLIQGTYKVSVEFVK